MDQKNDKKPGAPIPTLKETLRPQLKIKGLQSGQSLVERLKNFKKKDLAFILSGLGVLFMAPLAEHFLMSPEGGGDGAFQQGWNMRPGQKGLGEGGSPFEIGNGMAPGGAVGGGSDVITPLNVRDPSALVMGPGAQQQAPAVASSPAPAAPAAPSSGGSSDWKDALSQSAAKAGSAAVHKAALPVPKVPLSNGGLRGLGVASGGGGGSFNLAPVPGAQFGSGGRGDSTGMARASRDFRGAATRGAGSANAGGYEQLKKNAAAAGSDISRAGSALANLEQAAGRGMGEGRDGGGGGGSSPTGDKGPSGSQDKGSKQVGESLEFLRLKQEQEKAIDLKWEMIKKKAMFPIELQQEITKTLIMEPIKAIAGIPGKMLGAVPGSASSGKKWKCTSPNYETASPVGACEAGEQGAMYKSYPCIVPGISPTRIQINQGSTADNCSEVAGASEVNPQNTRGNVNGAGNQGNTSDQGNPNGRPTGTTGSGLAGVATDLKSACAEFLKDQNAQGAEGTRLNTQILPPLRKQAQDVAQALYLLDKTLKVDTCGAPLSEPEGADVRTALKDSSKKMGDAFRTLSVGAGKIAEALNKPGDGFTVKAKDIVDTQVKGAIDNLDKNTDQNQEAALKQAVTTAGNAVNAPADASLALINTANQTYLNKVVPAPNGPDSASIANAMQAGQLLGDSKVKVGSALTNLTRAAGLIDNMGDAPEKALTDFAKAQRDANPGNDLVEQASSKDDGWVKAVAQARTKAKALKDDYLKRQQYMQQVLEDLQKDNGLGNMQLKITGASMTFLDGKAHGQKQSWMTMPVRVDAGSYQAKLKTLVDSQQKPKAAQYTTLTTSYHKQETDLTKYLASLANGDGSVSEALRRAAPEADNGAPWSDSEIGSKKALFSLGESTEIRAVAGIPGQMLNGVPGSANSGNNETLPDDL